MKLIADFIIAIANVVEAEARTARKGVAKIITMTALICCGCTLLLGAFGLLVSALYLVLLNTGLSGAWASFITGLALLVVTFPLIGVAIWLAR